MAKREKNKDDSGHGPGHHVTDSGAVIKGKVITGEDTKLSAKEQGQRARGEIDHKGNKTDKEVKAPGVPTSEPELPLYKGLISAEATAAATGQKVSVRWTQEEPTTEDGLFHSFLAYHPSAIRSTFKVDTSNTIDPTLRTYLEK